MTLSSRLEDMEVTLEHMLMDVFVSLPTLNDPSKFVASTNNRLQLFCRVSFIATHDCSL